MVQKLHSLSVADLGRMSPIFCDFRLEIFFLGTKPLEVLVGCFLVIIDSLFDFQDAEVPWHLIAIATFFTFLKLLGPYYPYWGRIFIPHFANGGLWRTLWFALLWYRRPQKESTMTLQNSGNRTHSGHSELNKL